MRLRYASTCTRCGTSLAAATTADYDRASKTVACVACPPCRACRARQPSRLLPRRMCCASSTRTGPLIGGAFTVNDVAYAECYGDRYLRIDAVSQPAVDVLCGCGNCTALRFGPDFNTVGLILR